MPYLLLLIPAAFVGVLIFRALTMPSPHIAAERPGDIEQDEKLARELDERSSLFIYTKKYSTEAEDGFLAEHYPTVMEKAEMKRIGDSLLFIARGEGGGEPILISAIADAADASVDAMPRHEFSERGSFDSQYRAIALLEALEKRLKADAALKSDIYVLLAEDSDALGRSFSDFENEGLRFGFVMTEGSGISMVGGSKKLVNNVAGIGVCQKCGASFRLRAHTEPGVASDEPRESALDIVIKAASRIGKRPCPMKLDHCAKDFVRYALYNAGFMERVAAANIWCFSPILKLWLKKLCGEQYVRTTSAATFVSSSGDPDGVNEYALPEEAEMRIVCSALPGEDFIELQKRLSKKIRDYRVDLTLESSVDANAPADIDLDAFQMASVAAAEAFPNTNAAPTMLIHDPLPDSAYRITSSVLRFSPFGITPDIAGQARFFERLMLQI